MRADVGQLDELIASLKELGQLQPIIVDAKYNLISGERRYRAAKQLGWTEIEADIRDVDQVEAKRMEFAENYAREDFSLEDKVRAVKQLHDMMQEKYGRAYQGDTSGAWDLGDTAKKLGISRTKVHMYVRVGEAIDRDPSILETLQAHGITAANELLTKRHRRQIAPPDRRPPSISEDTVDEIVVLIETAKWLHSKGAKLRNVSIPKNQNLTHDQQMDKLRGAFSSSGIPFSSLMHEPNGPDIIAESDGALWKIECKGLGGGQTPTLRTNFDRAVASTVAYYDQSHGLRLGLAMPNGDRYLDFIRGRLHRAAREALNLWVFLVDVQSHHVRAIEPSENV
jgi:ParB/RepB/Spo0J family partition protein